MTKRTAVCGIPMYVVRKVLVPLIVVNGVVVLFFIAVSWKDSDYFTDLIIEEPQFALILLLVPALIPLIACVVFAVRTSKYVKRMKGLKGRACFVCNYEIAEGLDQCSECGAVWSLEDLNRYWRRNVGGEG
jgi:hypothetical protein